MFDLAAKKPMIQALPFSSVSSPEFCRDNLEPRPAVYAWYRAIVRRRQVNGEEFLRHLKRHLDQSHTAEQIAKLGWRQRVALYEGPGELSERAEEIILKLFQKAERRDDAVLMLSQIENLIGPLYVGSTSDLQSRVTDHISGNSGFSSRLQESGLSLSACNLKFLYIGGAQAPELNFEPIESAGISHKGTIEMFEEVFTRLTLAPFVKRPG